MGELEPRQEGGPEKIDFQNMNFEQLEQALKEAQELAARTFKQFEDGFHNVKGEGMSISERGGVYRIVGIDPKLGRVHELVGGIGADLVLINGSRDKEEVIQAIRAMLEKLGNRIIE